MFFSTKAFLAVLSCALVAHAQSSSGTSTSSAPPSSTSLPAGIDECILTCVTSAATSAGCASFEDLTCVCTSTSFQSAALQCLQQNCTAADVAAATQLQETECAALSSSSVPTSTPSGTSSSVPSVSASTPTTTPKSSSTSTSTSTSTTGTPTSGSSSGAMALSPFSFGSFVGTLVASAGALVGAALVL